MAEVLVWRPGSGLVPDDIPEGRLHAADSWLVRDGRVRAIDRHRERFFRACREVGGPPEGEMHAFWAAVLDALPREGLWFPRVEWAASLRVRIRPAPPPAREVAVRVSNVRDPRSVPRRKGPDLGVLAGMRAWASRQACQEALLVSKAGLILEAANASVLWWEGGRLCAPDPHLSLLEGVTSGLIIERATELGVPFVFRRRPPTHLNAREAWLVNALHGIRPVTRWVGAAVLAGPAGRAPAWQAWLDTHAEPLPERRPVSLSALARG
jgi:branched-subunit amino acid aminotransferase/4-amino-4-deoxychorismate lyase